jgi:hypothetical protein
MKNVVSLIRPLLLALSLPLTTLAHHHLLLAGPEKPKSFNVGMYQVQQSSRVSLAIAKPAPSRMTLLIRDVDGNILYREVVGKDKASYKRQFDLGPMGDGTYSFDFITNGEVVTKKVKLVTTQSQTIALY